MSFYGATGTPVLDSGWRLLWVSKPEWVLPYSLFAEANAMYILQKPPLVLHVPTSWQPALQPVLSVAFQLDEQLSYKDGPQIP